MDNIVFFSRHVKDPHSSPFLIELAKISSEKDFKRYCITGGDVELLKLLGITHVPTLVVDGVKMHGAVAWEWVHQQQQRPSATEDHDSHKPAVGDELHLNCMGWATRPFRYFKRRSRRHCH